MGREPLHSVISVHRTDALLLKLSLVVGKEVFYAALWGSVLASPAVRLPASLFVVGHISRDLPGKEQKHMLGTDHQLTVGAGFSRGWGEDRWACRHGLSLGPHRDVRGVQACEQLSQAGWECPQVQGNPGWLVFSTCMAVCVFGHALFTGEGGPAGAPALQQTVGVKFREPCRLCCFIKPARSSARPGGSFSGHRRRLTPATSAGAAL